MMKKKVVIQERVEIRVRSKKITHVATTISTRKLPTTTNKKKEVKHSYANIILTQLQSYPFCTKLSTSVHTYPQIATISQPLYQQPHQLGMTYYPPPLF
ncbi:hypothetical protein CR513_34065, partial [Mucuna pruriens]